MVMENITCAELPAIHLDEELFAAYYDDVFPVIASIISRQGGSRSDAEDIFHDALIALIDTHQRTVVDDSRRYLVGIAKHLWLRRAKTSSRFLKLDGYERALIVPDEIASQVVASTLLR